MTRQEAVQAMANGEKITHESFSDQEWMTMENGKILLEDGVRCSPQEFWQWRQGESWETGYSRFK